MANVLCNLVQASDQYGTRDKCCIYGFTVGDGRFMWYPLVNEISDIYAILL